MMLKYLIQTSIFRYSKNSGSLTIETRIKDSVNMEDLICLLATVRTLNTLYKQPVKNFLWYELLNLFCRIKHMIMYDSTLFLTQNVKFNQQSR